MYKWIFNKNYIRRVGSSWLDWSRLRSFKFLSLSGNKFLLRHCTTPEMFTPSAHEIRTKRRRIYNNDNRNDLTVGITIGIDRAVNETRSRHRGVYPIFIELTHPAHMLYSVTEPGNPSTCAMNTRRLLRGRPLCIQPWNFTSNKLRIENKTFTQLRYACMMDKKLKPVFENSQTGPGIEKGSGRPRVESRRRSQRVV